MYLCGRTIKTWKEVYIIIGKIRAFSIISQILVWVFAWKTKLCACERHVPARDAHYSRIFQENRFPALVGEEIWTGNRGGGGGGEYPPIIFPALWPSLAPVVCHSSHPHGNIFILFVCFLKYYANGVCYRSTKHSLSCLHSLPPHPKTCQKTKMMHHSMEML